MATGPLRSVGTGSRLVAGDPPSGAGIAPVNPSALGRTSLVTKACQRPSPGFAGAELGSEHTMSCFADAAPNGEQLKSPYLCSMTNPL